MKNHPAPLGLLPSPPQVPLERLRAMGCGNSSPASSDDNTGSGGGGGRTEFSSKLSDESLPEDDKHRNYGGVYVGLPLDLSNLPQVQIGSLRELNRDSLSLRTPLWGDGL